MQNNAIETVLSLLSGDNSTSEQLINLTKQLTQGDEKEQTPQNTVTDNKLQLKINLINSIIPLLGDKAAEQAQFLIKLMSVIMVINQLKNRDN